MLDRALIKQKIDTILQYREEITPLVKLSFRKVYKEIFLLRTLERNIQLIVDTAVDINTHILLEELGKVPPKNVESFLMLEELHIFPRSFLNQIAQSAGFRNRLVHEYEKADPYILFRSAQKFYQSYFRYCHDFLRWLERQK